MGRMGNGVGSLSRLIVRSLEEPESVGIGLSTAVEQEEGRNFDIVRMIL